MDLKTGSTFWSIKNGLIQNFPSVSDDLVADVLIIGAGITGSLAAYELARHGHKVIVVDKRPVAYGSTSASTALLQYEIDTHMVDLAKQFGEENAALAYKSCIEAINKLQTIATQFNDVEFIRQKSLYTTRKKPHLKDLRDEFDMRAKHGIDVEWLDEEALRKQYQLDDTYAGILSSDAAIVDPYRFCHRLLDDVIKHNGRVFARTRITHIDRHEDGITAHTEDGNRIRAKSVIIACGYESQNHLSQKYAKNRSTYAIVSEPILPSLEASVLPEVESSPRIDHFLQHTLYWETARPYPYIRRTLDGRILFGGEDDYIDIPAKRDALLSRKTRKLQKAFATRFPNLPFKLAFAWAGTFAETKDGLPYIGRNDETGDHVYFLMAFGGNGIVYSLLGSEIVRAQIEGREHELSKLFGFDRCDMISR